jgi:hypothetical protein
MKRLCLPKTSSGARQTQKPKLDSAKRGGNEDAHFAAFVTSTRASSAYTPIPEKTQLPESP